MPQVGIVYWARRSEVDRSVDWSWPSAITDRRHGRQRRETVFWSWTHSRRCCSSDRHASCCWMPNIQNEESFRGDVDLIDLDTATLLRVGAVHVELATCRCVRRS